MKTAAAKQPCRQLAIFMPDSAAPAHAVLQGAYYLQKDFFKKRARWAKAFDELELAVTDREEVSALKVRARREGYRVRSN